MVAWVEWAACQVVCINFYQLKTHYKKTCLKDRSFLLNKKRSIIVKKAFKVVIVLKGIKMGLNKKVIISILLFYLMMYASEKKEDLSRALIGKPPHEHIIDYDLAKLENEEFAGVSYTEESIENIQKQKAELRRLKATQVPTIPMPVIVPESRSNRRPLIVPAHLPENAFDISPEGRILAGWKTYINNLSRRTTTSISNWFSRLKAQTSSWITSIKNWWNRRP